MRGLFGWRSVLVQEICLAVKRNIKPLVQVPVFLLMGLLNSIYVSAQTSTLDFELNDRKIVVTPDFYLITWMNQDKYATDFSITSTNDSGVYACSTFCPQAALDSGAAYYKQFTVSGQGVVTVYYDASGKIVGTGADLDGDGLGNDYDNDADGDGVDDVYDAYPFDASRSSSQVGEVAGVGQVSPTGSAVYTIPINISPGTAGVQPQLSLNYNSQGGNGLLGVGWTLSGLSQINRCPQTTVNDGNIHGVDFTSEDRFCLDGQRLLVASGSYGSSSAYYRTEIDGFSRVSHWGSMGGGPAYFKVETKAGEVLEYSGMAASNRSEATVWLLTKVTDSVGNYLRVNYSTDPQGIGEYYPLEIKYTGHNNDENFENTVSFHYGDRPDQILHYMAGSKTFSTKRLIKITSSLGSYHLNYLPHVTAKSSRLQQIIQCDTTGNCLPPTRFNWSESSESAGWQADNGFAPPAGAVFERSYNDRGQGVRLLDINADGFIDIIKGEKTETVPASTCLNWVVDPNGNGPGEPEMVCTQWSSGTPQPVLKFQAWLGSATGFESKDAYAPLVDYPMTDSGKDQGIRFGDINGDGYPDMLYGYNDGSGDRLKAWRNNKTSSGGTVWIEQGTSPTVFVKYEYGSFTRKGQLVELNGDGMMDYISSGYGYPSVDQVSYFSTQSLTWQEPTEAFVLEGYEVNMEAEGYLFADFNADGYTDWVYSTLDGNGYEAKTTISHNFTASVNEAYKLPEGYHIYYPPVIFGYSGAKIVELNGDGLPDLIYPNMAQSIALINTGRSFEITSAYDLPVLPTVTEKFTWVANGSVTDGQRLPVIFIDVNGDGLDDALYAAEGQTAKAYLNTGAGWSENIANFAPPTATTSSENKDLGVRFVDVNGDGVVDMIRGWADSGITSYDAWLNQAKPILLESVTKGNGATTTFGYKTLTDDSTYTKGMNANTPIERDVQGPIYVVSNMSTSNGVGGLLSSTYKYEGLKVNTRGRGPLGFSKVLVTDEQSNITTSTEYRQDFPYIGLPWNVVEKQSNGNIISSVTNTYANIATAGNAKFPYVSSSVEKVYDFDSGSLLTEITTTTAYDGPNNGGNYGNPTRFEVVTANKQNVSESFSKVTVNQYKPGDTSKWILGRLSETTVVTSDAFANTQTRKSTFGYGDADGLLSWEAIEPDSAEPGIRLATIYARDQYGNINKKTACESTVSACAHDTTGNRTISTVYDADGRFPYSVTNSLGHTEYHTYDVKFGAISSLTGPNGLTTHWYYDGFGLQTKESRADGTETINAYTRCGSCPGYAKYYTSSRTTGSAEVLAYFDSMNRVIRKTIRGFDGVWVNVDTQYDARGRMDKFSEPYYVGAATIYWTQTFYDNLGRPIQIDSPGGDLDNNGVNQVLTKTIDYDKFKTTTTDSKNRTKVEEKNAIGQTIEIIDAANTVDATTMQYRYDSRSNLLETQIKNRPETLVKIEYDKRDRKERIDDPDMGVWTYKYNAFGELIEQVDAKAQKTMTVYDDMGRIKQRTDLVGTAQSRVSDWVYGVSQADKNIGKLTSEAISGGASKMYEYDGFGRLKEIIHTIDNRSYIVTQGYDAISGRLAKITYPSADPTNPTLSRYAIDHVYNGDGYLTKVQSAEAVPVVHWEAVDMNARGQLEQAKLANGVATVSNAYNLATGWLHGTVSDSSVGGILQHMSYFYDKSGNLKSRTDNRLNHIKTENFTYDDHDRLTSGEIRDANGNVIGIDKAITYDVNNLGNIASKTGVGSYSYGTHAESSCAGFNSTPGPHAVTQITGAGPEAGAYCYDANGNLSVGGGRSIEYTSFNKPSVLTKASEQVSFTYGADRSRVSKVVSNAGGEVSRTRYIGLGASGGALYQEEMDTQSGQGKHMYNIYVDGKVVGMHLIQTATSNGVQTVTSAETEYYLYDHLGSLEVVINAQGAIAAQQSHDAWGKRRNPDWTDNSSGGLTPINGSRGYTGHESIAEIGLVHMNGRVYDPSLGRFLSADPMVQSVKSSQSYNRYTYVFNNPLKYTDPTGYLSDDAQAIIEFAIGIALVYLGNPAGFTLGTALIQRSVNLANGNSPNQGVTLNYSLAFSLGKASRPKAYKLSNVQSGQASQVRARYVSPVMSESLMSSLQEITQQYVLLETLQGESNLTEEDKFQNGAQTTSYQEVWDDAGTVTPQQQGRPLVAINLPGLGDTYLDAAVAPMVQTFIDQAATNGVDLHFNSAFRTIANQAALQLDPTAITPAQLSLHSAGLAVDVNYSSLASDAQRTVVRNAASSAGLSWGGNFGTADPPHFYFNPGGDRAVLIQNAQANYNLLTGGN